MTHTFTVTVTATCSRCKRTETATITTTIVTGPPGWSVDPERLYPLCADCNNAYIAECTRYQEIKNRMEKELSEGIEAARQALKLAEGRQSAALREWHQNNPPPKR